MSASALSAHSRPAGDRSHGRRTPGPSRAVGLWALGLLATGALFVWLYLLTIHANSSNVNSDGATVILEGRAVASGNFLLHGWILSLDSWWTLDVLFAAAATRIVGLHPALLLVVPAVIATLTVAVGVVLAGRGRRDVAAAAGALTTVAVLAVPSHALAGVFLCGPIHVSTALYALVAFLALRRNRFGWSWVIAVVILAAGLLGDLQMVAYGVAPALLAGFAAMRRCRSVRAGAVATTAAVASVLVALAVRAVAVALGAFALGPTNPIASKHQMAVNLRNTLGYLGQLFGVHSTALGSGGVPAALQDLRIVAAVLVGIAFLAALARLAGGVAKGAVPSEGPTADATPGDPEPWRLDDLLVIASFGPMVAFVALAATSSPAYFRYLTATVIFSSILAGRTVTRWWATTDRAKLQRGAACGGVAVIAGYAAAVGYQLHVPASPKTAAGLTHFLETHHLTSGIGDYWSSSITTVDSGGRVRVRPVVAAPDGKLEAYNKGPVHAWFSGVRFQFVVFTSPEGFGGVGRTSAIATWGASARTYSVQGYDVMVWSHPIMVTSYEPREG